jgi:hypothetical protein
VSSRTPTSDGLTVAPNAPVVGVNPAASLQELQQTAFWGRYELLTQLPNVGAVDGVAVTGVNPANPPAYEKMRPGDIALVGTKVFWLISRGTPNASDATWSSTADHPAASTTSLNTIHTGDTPLVIGALWLVAGQILHQASHALIGVQTTGTATLRLRRQSTGVLLAGADWVRNATLGDQALAADVTVANTDWYTIELLGDDPATVSLAFGLQLL